MKIYILLFTLFSAIIAGCAGEPTSPTIQEEEPGNIRHNLYDVELYLTKSRTLVEPSRSAGVADMLTVLDSSFKVVTNAIADNPSPITLNGALTIVNQSNGSTESAGPPIHLDGTPNVFYFHFADTIILKEVSTPVGDIEILTPSYKASVESSTALKVEWTPSATTKDRVEIEIVGPGVDSVQASYWSGPQQDSGSFSIPTSRLKHFQQGSVLVRVRRFMIEELRVRNRLYMARAQSSDGRFIRLQ